ncbi:Uncharacterized conserved protein [Serratia fonticola]|uniref:Uncharacterized conserved protein n=1 Tax=Serratia fonticola TaxID=47917 RepID=A0A448TAT4_SERFO|nr:Uncharacterized conserved protein [Serratia fonticola]
MINFGHPKTIPARYANRQFYCHNSQVTLMRTTAQENTQLGRWIGDKLNACAGEVCFVVPLGGFSTLDAPGQPFWIHRRWALLFTRWNGRWYRPQNAGCSKCRTISTIPCSPRLLSNNLMPLLLRLNNPVRKLNSFR